MAFRLGLIAQGQGPTVGLAGAAAKTFAQEVVAVLGPSDFDIPVTGEFFIHQDQGFSGGVEGLVEAGGEEAGFEARGAEESLLGEGDALDGEEFLGVDGLVDGDEVVLEMGDLMEVFEADDGKGGGSETVFASILGGAGLALWGAGAGGVGSVGAIGGERGCRGGPKRVCAYPSALSFPVSAEGTSRDVTLFGGKFPEKLTYRSRLDWRVEWNLNYAHHHRSERPLRSADPARG